MTNQLPTNMDPLDQLGDQYQTDPGAVSRVSAMLPTFAFYRRFARNVYRSSRNAKAGRYDDQAWVSSSREVMRHLERVGVRFKIAGLDHIRNLQTPCVFVGNHMSMLETMVLPGIIQPITDVTFVVKQSLLDYPIFSHVMRSRNPVAVGRDNPREDLKTVMTQGGERLSRGISIIVFPQTTRGVTFDPGSFNSIGTKLASRNEVPVIPIALRTDAWANGKRFKDLGPIDPSKTVDFQFGAPIQSSLTGGQVQSQVIEFIQQHLHQFDA